MFSNASIFISTAPAGGLAAPKLNRMFAKLRKPTFLADVRPLLAAEEAKRLTTETTHATFALVFETSTARLLGEPWAGTTETADGFGVAPSCDSVQQG